MASICWPEGGVREGVGVRDIRGDGETEEVVEEGRGEVREGRGEGGGRAEDSALPLVVSESWERLSNRLNRGRSSFKSKLGDGFFGKRGLIFCLVEFLL